MLCHCLIENNFGLMSAASTHAITGFNAGLSAILLLEASRTAQVLSFDLGDFAWARRANGLVREYYGKDRFPGVIFGNSHRTLFELAEQRKLADKESLRCDAAFIDGAKTFAGRLQHIEDVRAVSPRGARIFLDEVTSQECVDGSLGPDEHDSTCKRLQPGYYEATRAYTNASRRGIMRVIECAWPPRLKNVDGICMAELL